MGEKGLEETLKAMMVGLSKVYNNPDITVQPDWLGGVLTTHTGNLTTETVTPAMLREVSAGIEVSIAQSEGEREKLIQDQKIAERKISEAKNKEQDLRDLQNWLCASSEEIQERKEELQ